MPAYGSALDYVKQIRGLTTFGTNLFEFRLDGVSVDNVVFKLHSRITVCLLLVGTVLVTMKQHFGEPIECLPSKVHDIVSAKQFEHYCWTEGVFSVYDTNRWPNDNAIRSIYPGVKTHAMNDDVVHHKYYQWVFFVLFIQSVLFYVPKYMWRAKEDRRLQRMIVELKSKHIKDFSEADRQRLLQDLADSLLIGNDYFRFFIFCEFFYLVHLVFEIWLTNIFLSGSFVSLGTDWFRYTTTADRSAGTRHDPLTRVFPRLTKCTFNRFGSTGTVEVYDSLCFLWLNIVNEKVYLILWFWFLILTIVTVIIISYHISLYVYRPLRYRRLRALAPSTNRRDLQRLTSRVGNWFVLQFVARHIKPSHFRDLIEKLMIEHYDVNGKPHYLSKLAKTFASIVNNPNSNTLMTTNGVKSETTINMTSDSSVANAPNWTDNDNQWNTSVNNSSGKTSNKKKKAKHVNFQHSTVATTNDNTNTANNANSFPAQPEADEDWG